MKKAENFNELTKAELIELLNIYAKNWLAHDGAWFLAHEKKYGIETAIEMDTRAWEIFTVIEAKRMIEFLNLRQNSGLAGLKKALQFRLYSSINEDEIIINGNTLEYRVKTCRVQAARRRKGLEDFPCKSVGIVEFSLFAKTIDERFTTEVISCPPEITNRDYFCTWKFILNADTNIQNN